MLLISLVTEDSTVVSVNCVSQWARPLENVRGLTPFDPSKVLCYITVN